MWKRGKRGGERERERETDQSSLYRCELIITKQSIKVPSTKKVEVNTYIVHKLKII